MASREQIGNRDASMAYSVWHREQSIARFLSAKEAWHLPMMDVDHFIWLEWKRHVKKPVAVIESKLDVGQEVKMDVALLRDFIRPEIPIYVVLFTLSADENPHAPGFQDVEHFKVAAVSDGASRLEFRGMSPLQYARFLNDLRIERYEQLEIEEHERELGIA